MFRRIFVFSISIFLFFNSLPVYSQDFSNKSIDKYIDKVANKFSRTYCNTTRFGISEEGALAFAIGETNKEFKYNNLNELVDFSFLTKKIIDSLENKCQVYNFPIKKLENLKLE